MQFGPQLSASSAVQLWATVALLSGAAAATWADKGYVDREIQGAPLGSGPGNGAVEALTLVEALGTPVRSVAVSPDSRFVVSGYGTYGCPFAMRVWDTAWNKNYSLNTRPGGGSTTSMAFSPDSRFMVSGGTDGMARVWDTATWRNIKTLNHTIPEDMRYAGGTTSVAYSPDSRFVVSGAVDGKVRVWNTTTWTKSRTLDDWAGQGIMSVAVSPDSRFVVSGSLDGTMWAWSTTTWTPINQQTLNSGMFECARAKGSVCWCAHAPCYAMRAQV